MKNLDGFNYKELFLLAIEKPLLAQIEITRNCNQNCFFCFRECSPSKRFIDKPIDDWKKVIDRLINLGIEEINFSGGEVFLYKNCFDFFKYIKNKGIKRIIVNTNGLVNLNEKEIENIDELVFSIHGINNVHDKITGITGSFKIAINNLKNILGYKYPVGINTVVTPDNINMLDEIYNYFKKFNLIYHSFNLFIDRNNITKRKKEILEIFPFYLKFLKKINPKKLKLRHGMENIFIKNKSFFISKIPLPHCAGGKYKIVIDYLGDVYPCQFFQNKNYYCGNVFTDNLKEIWENGKGFKKFREIVINEQYSKKCMKCFKKDKCLGGCLAWRIYNNKLKQYEKDIRCKIGNAYIRD